MVRWLWYVARTNHTTLSIIEGSKVLVLNLRATLGQCGVLIINYKRLVAQTFLAILEVINQCNSKDQ